MSEHGFFTKWIRLVIAAVIGTPIVMAITPMATVGATTTLVPQTSFAIDGNSAGPTDFDAAYGAGTTPGGLPTTGLYYNKRNLDGANPCGTPDDSAQGGISVGMGPVWPTGGPNPNKKTNLDSAYVAAEKVDVNGTINDILYVGYLSCEGGSGTWQTSLYVDDGDGIPPTGGDANGDYLFIFDFNPSDGSTVTSMYKMVNGAYALSNPNPAAIEGKAGTAGDFGEVALNLTTLNIIPSNGVCTSVNVTGQNASITGGDLSSQVKDLVAVEPLTISNCGSLNVTKTANPATLTSPDLFHYIVSRTPAGPVHDGTLDVSGVGAGTTEPDADVNEVDANITVGETDAWKRMASQPNYTITENNIPSGWALSSIVCSYTDIFSPTLATKNVTIVQNGLPVAGAKFMIPPSLFDNAALPPASCTITNSTSGIVIAKNGSGSAATFDFTLTGKPNQAVALGAASNVIPFTPGSSVTITELAEAGTPAWNLTAVDCDDPGNAVRAGNGITVTTVAGQVITCTFTNNQAGKIVVNKTGAPTGGSFGFDTDVPDGNLDGNADSTIPIGGSFNTGDIPAGSYHINELLSAANAVADPDFVGSASCSVTTAGSNTSSSMISGVNATVTLGAGDIVTCTFNNTQNGRIVVAKNTVNGTNGDSFSFTGTGVNPGSITVQNNVGTTTLSKDVAPGTYGVAETSKPGYTLTGSSCSDSSAVGSIDVSAGEIVTCTFTNTRNSATFTLDKDWGNANPGEVVNLAASATGPAPISAPIAKQSTAPTDAGASMTVYSGQTISFSEAFGVPANASNYTSSVSCVDGQGAPIASGLTIAAGNRSGSLVVGNNPVNVTCTISNTLKQGGVIVQKEWVNGRAGDTAALSAQIGAGTPVQDTSVAPAGPVVNPEHETLDNVVFIPAFAGDTVNFSESLGGNAGLYTTTWSCTNQAASAGPGTSGQVTLAPADATANPVVCTITNTRKTATLELSKEWGSSPITADEVKLDIGTGGALATAQNAVDGTPNGKASVVVLVGETYPFAESFSTGDAANYTSTWSCDAASDTSGSGVSSSVAVSAADAGTTVKCKFVNERKTMTLKLQKAWVNGHAGDTAQLAIDGINDGNATSTATSALGTVTDTSHAATITAYAGETVTLNETVTPGANYNSSLACGAHALTYSAGARTGSIAIAPADATTTVTCTYTNTRKSATLTVEKTWNDPVGGESVVLAASGGLSAGLTGNATSTSPNPLVAPGAPTMTVFAGETITVSESFDDAPAAGMFSTTLSCATPGTVGNVVSGSIVLGSDPANTTCTFHNVRKSATLTLRKSWTNGDESDKVVLSITGTGPVTTQTAQVPDGGDGLSVDTASQTVYAGQDVLLSELFNANNLGTYTIASFACDDGTPDSWSVNDTNLVLSLLNGGDVADAITCTVSNVRTASTLTLEKEWVDPAAGPAAVTLHAAGSDANAADSDQIVSTSPAGESITIDVLSGETVSISEVFDTTGGKLGAENYATTLDCTGLDQQSGVYDDQLVIADNPSPITCTFTNTRKSTTLTLEKAWVKPVAGDQVTLSIDGTNDDTSGAVVAPATTETASVTVYAGETLTISEAIAAGNTAIYDVDSINCTAGTVGWSGAETDTDATVAVSAANVASPITCTITNSAQRGTIVVVKNTQGGNGTFHFAGTWAGAGGFDLTTVAGTSSTTYPDVLVPKQGGYSVTESDPTPSFDGTNVTCSDTDGGSGPSASSTKPLTGSIDLDDDETVTCTFTNTARATIVIVKDAQPNSAQDFGFTTTGLATASFTLDDDGDAGNGTSNTFTSALVPAGGTYTVTEGATFGWTLSPNSSCTTGGTFNGSTATIVPAPGATVTCTFVNTANPAGLTATKHVDNQVGPWGPFTFVLSGGTFTGNAQQDVNSSATTASWTNLVEGQTYTVVENGPVPGYTLGAFTCLMSTGGTPSSLPDADAQAAGFQFVAVAGAQYQCDITNTAISPTLVVNKTTVGGVGTFNFDVVAAGANPASPASLTATTSAVGIPASTAVSTLKAGEGYSVSEQQQAAWIAGDLTCTVVHAAGGPAVAYAFNTPTLPGDVITCSITNTRKATITVWKQTTPDGANQAFGFEGSWNGASDDQADFELFDGMSSNSGLLTPGVAYFVEELATDGWTLTGVTCRGDTVDNPASVTPAPGENVECVFSNSQRGDVTVEKVADPASIDRDGTSYSVSYTLTVRNASYVDESYDLSDVPAFASGVAIESMVVNGPGVVDLDLGADGGGIVTDGTIGGRAGYGANQPLVFTVVVTFTMAGDTDDRACAGADSGTFNTATVVFDRGSNSDSDCVPLPSPKIEMTKVAEPATATHISGNQYEVSYTITVSNTGEGAGSYTLADVPDFGAGIEIVSLEADSDDATVNPGFWTGDPVDDDVAIDQAIQAGEIDVFTITAVVNVAYDSVADARQCDEQQGAGHGAFNTASLTSNGPGTPDSSACVSLPLPQITVEKDADQPVAELVDGNTYTASYTVTVTNTGDGPGQYDLSDLPAFGAGANVTEVDIAPAIVDDVDIDPHDIDEYSVTVTFTVDPAMPASERECGVEPTAGQGAYNGVTVHFNDDGSDSDADCVDIPQPDITVSKVATTDVAALVSGNDYEAVYTVTVHNAGDGPGEYTLDDLPEFGTGANVTDVSFDPVPVEPVAINAGGTDVYTVTVLFTVDPAMPAGERECAEVPTAGQGAYNGVTVHFNDGGSDHSADCVDIPKPGISVSKSANTQAAVLVSGNTYEAEYTVTVTNPGTGPGEYSLADLPDFGDGADVVGDPVFVPVINGVVGIEAGGIDVYTVTVLFTVDPAMPAGERECADVPTAGQGAYNLATVTFEGGSDDDSACMDIPVPDIEVTKVAKGGATLVSGNTYEAQYTVTVTNNGDGPGSYTLNDLPDFGDGANVVGEPEFDPAIAGAVGLNAGDSDVYTVTVTFTVDPAMPAGERECAEVPTAGQGAYNGVTVHFNDGGSDHSAACIDIPTPDISVEKVATTDVATKVSGNTYKAVYTVTVTNNGDGPGSYTLNDLPDFGTGANIVGVPVFEPAISGAVGLNAGDSDVYTVTVTFTVDGSMTDGERECFTQPTPGAGAYNGVTVNFNDGGSDHSADCIDIPEPDISRDKIVDPEHPLTRNADGSWTVGYVLTVSNGADAGPATYDIDDELAFGPGVEVNDVVVSEDIASVTVDPEFDGQTHTNIASDVSINGGETHEYHVLLTLEITVVPGINGDCGSEGGINNSLIVSVRGIDGEPVSVCSGFATLTLIKQLSEVSHGGNATIDDFTLSASAGDPSVTLLSGHSGVSAAVPAGTYALAEAAYPGYEFVAPGFVCSNEDSGFSVDVLVGQNVVCTITNQDLPVDLELTKDDAGFVATAGQQTPFPYTITITNVGERDLDDEPVTVVDDLPSVFEWVAPAPAGCVINGQQLTCDVDPAALREPGDEITITATARLKLGVQDGTYDNRAYVTTSDDPVCVPTGEAETCTPPPCSDTEGIAANNNVDCEPTPVERAIRISAIVPQCISDAPYIFYSIEALGFTPVTTPTIKLFDKNGNLVATYDVPTFSGRVLYPGAQVDAEGNPIDWPGWKFENGLWSIDESDAFLRDGLHVVVEVNPTAEADVTYPPATEACANPQQVSADLAIVKDASVPQVGAGGAFTWVLNVTNNGPDTATAVEIGDIVPSQLVVTGVSSSQFNCTTSGNAVTCTKPAMAVGETGQITISVSVPASAASATVTNVGTVEAVTPDPNLTNNSDDASVDIVAQAPPTTTLPPVVLPPTGSNSTTPVTRAAFVLLLLGGLVTVISRRRRSSSSVG
jgi:uncharacterized repeat protein (TIGR01451 family)